MNTDVIANMKGHVSGRGISRIFPRFSSDLSLQESPPAITDFEVA